MGYTLEQFSADCRAALLKDPGPAGRELVRQYTAKASSDPDFVATYLGPDANSEREDPLRRSRVALLHSRARLSGSEEQPAARPRAELGSLQPGGGRDRDDGLAPRSEACGRSTRQGREGSHLQADARDRAPLQRGRSALAAARWRHAPDPDRGYRPHQGEAGRIRNRGLRRSPISSQRGQNAPPETVRVGAGGALGRRSSGLVPRMPAGRRPAAKSIFGRACFRSTRQGRMRAGATRHRKKYLDGWSNTVGRQVAGAGMWLAIGGVRLPRQFRKLLSLD